MAPTATLPTEVSPTTPANINGSITEQPVAETRLAKLPIPKLKDTCQRYLRALEGLQDAEEHAHTKQVVDRFLTSGEGEKWQSRLEEYGKGVESYIEEFWCMWSMRFS